MHRVENEVNPEMVILGRMSRGLTQTSLAERLSCSQGTVSKLEHGQQSLSSNILNGLIRALRYPKSFFFETGERYLPGISYHRKRESLRKKDRETIEGITNVQRIHVRKLLRAAEVVSNVPMLDLQGGYESPEEVAQVLRYRWEVPRGPISDLTSLVENAGIIVIHRDFGTDQLDGLSYPYADLPIVFLNTRLPNDRMRFTLAHELGHMVMHKAPGPSVEAEADRFASEFLMPADDIAEHLQPFSIEALASLKPYWRTSMASMLTKAGDLNILTENQQRYQWAKFSKKGYRKREPQRLDLPPEQPKLLDRLVNLHFEQLRYSVEQLSDLLCLTVKEFKRMYSESKSSHLRLIK